MYKGKVNILLNIKNCVNVSNKETTFSVYHEHIRTCTLSGGCCPASIIGCIFYHHWAWLIWFSYHAKNHYVLMDDRRKQQDILGSFSRNQESMKPDSQGDSKIRSPDCWGADGGDSVYLASSVTVLRFYRDRVFWLPL